MCTIIYIYSISLFIYIYIYIYIHIHIGQASSLEARVHERFEKSKKAAAQHYILL